MRRINAVIGAGYGDEGKGVLTDFLTSQSCDRYSKTLVVRFSGGHQAGHTVVYNGIRHVFSNFGSGTLRGAETYFSKFCTISPIGIYKEYKVLVDKGIHPILIIDPKCPIVTPYDEYYNILSVKDIDNGTCGMGFGATIEREEKHYHLLAEDLFYSKIVDIKLNMISQYYKIDYDLSEFQEACEFILSNKNIRIGTPCATYNQTIYEGSQGLMLDQDIGFFPHVTRSNTGTKNLLQLTKTPEFYVVTRAYQTRHGNGPLTNYSLTHNIKANPLETNVTNQYQGQFRRSLLDIDVLKYAINKDCNIKNPILVITCLDHIKEEYRFIHNGDIVCCNDEDDFCEQILLKLDIQKCYINDSEESKTFRKFGW